jgi:hypothetical protein
LLGGQEVSLQSVAAIEAAVRGYFDAFERSDTRGLQRNSTGELKILAGRQRSLNAESGPRALEPAAASIDSLEIVSVEGDTATVEIKGQLDETVLVVTGNLANNKLVSTDISGAVTVVRGTTWQVADYHREGHRVSDQLYTKVRGQRTSQGVVVKVIGVDLRPKGTVVIIEVNNKTGLKAGAINPVIVDAAGKRLRTPEGRNVQVLDVARRSKTSQEFFFMKGLRANVRKFNFQITFILCRQTASVCALSTDLDIPVRLVR